MSARSPTDAKVSVVDSGTTAKLAHPTYSRLAVGAVTSLPSSPEYIGSGRKGKMYTSRERTHPNVFPGLESYSYGTLIKNKKIELGSIGMTGPSSFSACEIATVAVCAAVRSPQKRGL
jgi:hypothetical protein